jgi:hypothetical protein
MTAQIRRHARSEAASFHVLRHNPCRPELPLVVIVHPGDMLETGQGYSAEEGQQVREFSRRNQIGTAREIAQWRSLPAEVIVINRSSCTQFVQQYRRHVTPEMEAEMKTVWRSDTVLFGDDLDAVNVWMAEHMALQNRPHVYMAGAYSDPEYGCLTYIGRPIAKLIGADKVTVSEYSPPSASPDDPRWDPKS